MDGMDIMIKEQAPFLLLSGEVPLDDEFMVVPTLAEAASPATQLDEFLLEANFAGDTGSILSPFNEQVHNFCTIEGDGGRQSDAPTFQNLLFGHPCQETFLQEQQYLNGAVDGGNGAHYFDDNFDFTGQIGNEPVQEAADFGEVWQAEEEPVQFSELDDPASSWLAENADLLFIERMTCENEQQCQLLDELLRDEHVFENVEVETIDESGVFQDFEVETMDEGHSEETEVSNESSEILNEIYREAQELDFTTASTISNGSMDNSWTPSTVRFERAVAPKITKSSMSAHFHLADHDFGSAKRGRPPGSSRKRNTVKREFKKRDQNREAALRYRLKKRAEQKEKETDLEQLQKRNQFLKNEKYSLTAEVSYLKDLLIEIRKLKGYQ